MQILPVKHNADATIECRGLIWISIQNLAFLNIHILY